MTLEVRGGEKENEIKGCLCICQIIGLCLCVLFGILPSSSSSGGPCADLLIFFWGGGGPAFKRGWRPAETERRETRRRRGRLHAQMHTRSQICSARGSSPLSLRSPQTKSETSCNTHFMRPSLASALSSYCSAVSGESYGFVSVAAAH